MIGFQVVRNDTAVALAAQAGQFELNVMTPGMIYNILESMALLINYLPVFRKRCVVGIKANEENCRSFLELKPVLVTFLSPKIGYLQAAELAKEALEKRVPVIELAVMKEILRRKKLMNS